MFRIGTLFSGIGAPEQAAGRVYGNHEIVFACEMDKFARKSYESNYNISPDHFYNDINDMSGKQYRGEVDMIVGGSPCQDFSIAGMRAGVNGHRGKLIWQFFRIIDEARPPVFIYENVKGMVSDAGGRTLKDFVEVFRSIGYGCHAGVLDTKDYGVPQHRERLYIVGFMDIGQYYNFSYAPKAKLTKRLRDVLESSVDKKYYLSGKTMLRKVNRANNGGQSMVSVVGMLDIKAKDQIKCICSPDGVSPTITAVKGGGHEPKILQSGRGSNRRREYTVSPTLTSSSWQDNNHLLWKEGIRRLTPMECLRLQDFPDTFKQVVSNSQLYKQAGNSMSVNVVEMIMRQVEKSKAGGKDTLFGQFRDIQKQGDDQ